MLTLKSNAETMKNDSWKYTAIWRTATLKKNIWIIVLMQILTFPLSFTTTAGNPFLSDNRNEEIASSFIQADTAIPSVYGMPYYEKKFKIYSNSLLSSLVLLCPFPYIPSLPLFKVVTLLIIWLRYSAVSFLCYKAYSKWTVLHSFYVFQLDKHRMARGYGIKTHFRSYFDMTINSFYHHTINNIWYHGMKHKW